MEPWIGSAIVTVVAAAAAGFATLITTQKKSALDQRNAVAAAVQEQQLAHASALQELRLAYDRALRDLRLPHYQRLYHVSGCIPRDWHEWEVPTAAKLLEFRQGFHDWYFGEEAGGLFLTEAARDRYFHLMNELERQGRASPAPPADVLEQIKNLASDLRHQLIQDVGTAEPPQFEWRRIGYPPPPPSR